jgi:hypothetical protein
MTRALASNCAKKKNTKYKIKNYRKASTPSKEELPSPQNSSETRTIRLAFEDKE